MTSNDLETIAQDVKAAQDGAQPLEPLTSRYEGFNLAAAYDVAQRVHVRRVTGGAQSVGRKIGFTNKEMWARYGVGAPIWGYMYDTTVTWLADGPASCSLAGLVEPKIEPEIALHFRAAPPETQDPALILDSIDGVAHAFEIVQSHFPGWRFQAPDSIADGALHGKLLIGSVQPVERLGANLVASLESLRVSLLCDGQMREQGRGSNVLGSPLLAAAHLVQVLAAQRAQPLHAGEWVTTGTLTAALAVSPGQRWCTKLEGISLPGLDVTFTR